MEKVFLTTNRGIEECVCPRCNSINTSLGNVKLLARAGDCSKEFFPTGYGLTCNKCGSSFITEYETIKAMAKMPLSNRCIAELSFQNAAVSYDPTEGGYLFRAEGTVNERIYEPWNDFLYYYGELEIEKRELIDEEKLLMLRSKSILYTMGYRINLDEENRHRILKTTSRLFGKRTANGTLSFLISSRTHNGVIDLKNAYAVSVWKSDKEYLKTVVCNQRGIHLSMKHANR